MRSSVILAVFSAIAPVVVADCCYANKCLDWRGWPNSGYCNQEACDDSTEPTPCCGYGSCDIFCCNCDGGCRRDGFPGPSRRSTSEGLDRREVSTAFEVADTDSSGNVTLSQYTAYMGAAEDSKMHVDFFNKHDKNGDGVITPDEVAL